jgi:hypothetical protein
MPLEPKSLNTRSAGWLLAGIAGIAFVMSVVVGRSLYPLGSLNHDDAMYAFQARLLLHGHLSLPASFEPFRPWASGTRNGHIVLKYTPVWPAMLALGDRLGSMRFAAAGAAAAAAVFVGLIGREMFGRWLEGLLAAAVLVLSPLFLFQSGTYLPYVFEFALEAAIVWLVVSAVHDEAPRGRRVRLVLSGFLWGAALFARQYDALLLALPLVIAAAIAVRHRPRRLVQWGTWAACGTALPILALLSFNAVLMGSPLRNTFNVTGPNDTLGFGSRGVFPTTEFKFTMTDAAVSVERNLAQLPGWTFGGYLLLALAAIGLWRSRRQGFPVWAVAGIAASFTIGYALFWSPYSIVKLWPGARTLGPFYHLALLIPIAIFSACALGALFDRSRMLGGVAIGVLAISTAFAVSTRVDRNGDVTDEYRAARVMVDDAHLDHAVLFLEDRGQQGFESATPFLENTPSLSTQRVIYAIEGGPGDLDVLARYPDRVGARLRSELRPGDEILNPTRFIERLHVSRGTAVTLRFRIVNTVGFPTVVSKMTVGNTTQQIVLDTVSKKGATYEVAWTLTTAPTTKSPTDMTVAPGRGTATVQAEFVANDGKSELYERRYPYIATDARLAVLQPGVGRYYFQFGSPVWLDQDVTPTLAQTG